MKKKHFARLLVPILCLMISGCGGGSDGDGKSSGKNFLEFKFSSSISSNLSSGIITDISGTVDGSTITVNVLAGTKIDSLVADFIVSENAAVEIGTTRQESGHTINNFSNPVTYTVKAEDGSIQNYKVTVNISPETFYVWGRSFGDQENERIQAFCTDSDGNAYLSMAHSYSQPSRFIKIDSRGNTVWTKNNETDGTNLLNIDKLEADSSGNIYAKAITPEGVSIVKYGPSGNELWKKTIKRQDGPTSSYSYISAFTTDPTGSVYLAGRFSGTVDFDPDDSDDSKTAVSRCDEEKCTYFNNFLTKINADGSYGGTTVFDSLADFSAIGSDSSGNIYITGYVSDFYSAIWNSDYDPGPGLDQKRIFGGLDIILIKINSNGSYGWSKLMGGTGRDKSNDIAIDRSGNIYITGEFEGQSDFNPEGGGDLKTATADNDVFLTKIKPDGTYSWTKTFGAGETARGKKVEVDESGNIYLSGYFWGSADFDPGQGTDIKQSVGNSDIFLTKINHDGSYSWTKTFEPDVVLYEEAESLYLSAVPGGDICLAGLFYNSMDLNPGNGKDIVSSNGYSDAFLARLHP